MIRWKLCLVLAMLLLLPVTKSEEDEESESGGSDEVDEDDYEEEDDNDGITTDRKVERTVLKADLTPNQERTTKQIQETSSSLHLAVTRTARKRPLECFVCAFKADTPLRACLDPTKYRVRTLTCHSSADRCFTSVSAKENTFQSVVRGCRTGCTNTKETTCCAGHRCNNQAFALPLPAPQMLVSSTNKVDNTFPPNVFFFVTILLVLQTVAKVLQV